MKEKLQGVDPITNGEDHTNVGAITKSTLMGAALSQQQTDLVAGRFSEIVLMLDGDPAGREGTRDAASRLIGHSSVQRIMLAPGRQPDEMSSDEIGQALRDVTTNEKFYTKSLTNPHAPGPRRMPCPPLTPR